MIKRTAFAVIFAAILLGVLELVLRVVFPLPEETTFNRINYSALIHTPGEVRPSHLANVSFTWSSSPDGATFRHDLNLYGFRDRTWPVHPPWGGQRVMFVGDSFTEGYMAANEETIPAGFERAAKKDRCRITAMNLGVGASQPPSYCSLVRDAVPLFKPDYLVIVFYANDFPSPAYDDVWFTPTFVPHFRNPRTPRLYTIAKRFLSHKPVPLFFRRPPFPFIAPPPDPRNPWSSPATAASLKKFVSPKLAEAMQNGTFNPFVGNTLARNRVNREDMTSPVNAVPLLRALLAFSQAHSCKLLIAYIPFSEQVSDAYLPFHSEYSENKHPTSLTNAAYQLHARELSAACRKLEIPFLDLTPRIRAREEAGERLYWNYDEHMKGSSYLMVGGWLYDWFSTLPRSYEQPIELPQTWQR